MAGSIKLFRQFRDWEWYQDENVKSVFIELLLTANYKDLKWQGKTILRGQLVTSRAKLAAYLGKSEQNIRTALSKLSSTGEIDIKTTNKYTLITICKYDYWQSQNGYEQPTTNQQLTNEQPTTNQQLTTSKESKEYKEIEEGKNIILTQRTREEEWLEQMRRLNTLWQEDARRCLKIENAALTNLINQFETECKAKNLVHQSWQDITRHFIDWSRIQVKNESNGNKSKYDPTMPYEPKSTREDYYL